MGTIQIITKTNCCNKNNDEYNEDLHQYKDEHGDDKEKLIVERINSFNTDLNNTVD